MMNDFDKQVGSRIRRFRKMRGMTMEQLAAKLGVTFQQVQKYERGTNRISFERLYQLSLLFEVPLTAWLETQLPVPVATSRAGEDRQALALIASYHAIAAAEHRSLLCALGRALASTHPARKES